MLHALRELVVRQALAVDPLAYFSADEIRAWRAYQEPHYVHGYASLAVYLAVMAWLVFFGGSARIKRWADRTADRLLPATKSNALLRALDRVWRDRTWVSALLFVAVVFTLLSLLDLPGDVYFRLVYDKRYGLSTYTVPRFVRDYSVNYATFILLRTLLAFSVYALIRRMAKWWWLALGLAAAVGAFFLSGMVDPYRDALTFTDKPMPDGPARAAVAAVLEEAHVSNQGIYVRNASRVTRSLNAFFAGEGPSRRVVLYDTLVDALSPRELAVSVAHEIGHLKEPRAWKNAATGAAMFAFIFGLDRLLRAMARRPRFGLRSHADPTGLPVAFLMVSVVANLTEPATAAYSRSLERDADAFALELTRDPDAYVSLFTKLARLNKADVEPPAWVRWEFSHPTVMERLAFGEEKRREAGDRPRLPPLP